MPQIIEAKLEDSTKEAEAATINKMGILRYWRTVLLRAWYEAWCFMIPHSLKTLVRDLGLLAVALGLLYWLQSPLVSRQLMSGDNAQDTVVWLIITAVALVAVFAIVFVVQALFIVPYKMWEEQKDHGGKNGIASRQLRHPAELQRAVLIHQYDVKKKSLKGTNPYVEIEFWVFNGCGLPIQITGQITGMPKLRSPIRESATIVGEPSRIRYPGHGTFVMRIFLTAELIEESKTFNESPAAKALDKMWGDPPTRDIIPAFRLIDRW